MTIYSHAVDPTISAHGFQERVYPFHSCGRPCPSMQQLKKENLWIQILESLHPEEAELLDMVKDGKLTDRYKITRQNVIDAFPQLKLQDED